MEAADWATLRGALQRISGSPNNARASLDAVVALLEDERLAGRVRDLGFEFLDSIDAMDYNKYFDAMPTLYGGRGEGGGGGGREEGERRKGRDGGGL